MYATGKEQKNLNERLLNGIWDNDLQAVKTAVADGADVNAVRQDSTMLHQSIFADMNIAEYLLESGANPNVQDREGQTPLHNAAYFRHLEKVKLFLKFEADMYIKDKYGDTPLVYSAGGTQDYQELLEIFQSCGYTFSGTEIKRMSSYRLLLAVNQNDLSAVRSALEEGADVNFQSERDSIKLAPLHISVYKDAEITEFLLRKGALPNIGNISHCTSLHIAAQIGEMAHVKLLLAHKADMTLKNEHGRTPFAEALICENYDISELFVLAGYIPEKNDFRYINSKSKREQINAHFTALAAQVQKHNVQLCTEIKVTEFAYADEIIEI